MKIVDLVITIVLELCTEDIPTSSRFFEMQAGHAVLMLRLAFGT